ncbi:MAG: thermosome subunit beta [Candidatus Thorarchaeota archaeon]|nr:MAG: thermosome subunit [Candidatus Thorarchaeota archaeon]RLI53615.1 MAG: thermosome subunit [Candidatus Thorarchaeota archaeon]
MSQVPVIVLKEDTERTRGRDAQRNNIMAAVVIAEAVKSALGPKGMDKMLVDSFGDVTVSNDGATILKEMDVAHPAAKMVIEVAKTVDTEVGDGTTTAAVLTGELLKQAETLLDQNIHPTTIITGYRKAAEKAMDVLEEIAEKVDPAQDAAFRKVLRNVAKTAMSSKFVSTAKDKLADVVVDAVLSVAKERKENEEINLDNIPRQKQEGMNVSDTELVHGIVLDKEVVHAGMPKKVENPKIAVLECALEIIKTEFDAKISITDPSAMQRFLDEEQRMLKEMIDKIVEVGANVVICQKGIDDVAQHYLAKHGILAVRRIKKSDIERLHKATGATIVSKIQNITADDLGTAELVEQRKVGDDKMLFIEGTPKSSVVTLMVRGGTEHVVDEVDRALNDALYVVKDVVEHPYVLYGGGAVESHVATRLREFASSLEGREQYAVNAFADALEALPATLAENAGLDPIDIIVALRSAHSEGKVTYGINIEKGKVHDMKKARVVEPAVVKKQVIASAAEASQMILKIDDVISSKSAPAPGEEPPDRDLGDED